jgi:hypothetical protein
MANILIAALFLLVIIAYRLIPSGLTVEIIGIKLSLMAGFLVVPFLLRLVGAGEIRYLVSILKWDRESCVKSGLKIKGNLVNKSLMSEDALDCLLASGVKGLN